MFPQVPSIYLIEYFICVGDLCQSEEKTIRVQNELRHVLESLAIMLGTPTKFCEASELSIKERIRDLLGENKDKSSVSRLVKSSDCFEVRGPYGVN